MERTRSGGVDVGDGRGMDVRGGLEGWNEPELVGWMSEMAERAWRERDGCEGWVGGVAKTVSSANLCNKINARVRSWNTTWNEPEMVEVRTAAGSAARRAEKEMLQKEN